MNTCNDGLFVDIGRTEVKPIWTIEDLIELTGMKRQTIYNNIKSIPHRKKNGRLYFFPQEILNWIDEGDLD